MITPEEIRGKALRFYEDKLLHGAAEFPWIVTGNKSFPEDMPLAERIQALDALREASKESTGAGYLIHWVERRQHGRNRMPGRIVFETQADLLSFLGKEGEYRDFLDHAQRLKTRFPELTEWVESYPRRVIKLAPIIEGVLEVLEYFRQNPQPGLYLRELPLSVDTKFVERHRAELAPLMDLVLPKEYIDFRQRDFDRRYGLPWIEPMIRLRFLDPALQAECGQPTPDPGFPLLTLARQDWPVRRVLIVENLTNLYTLPFQARTLGLMGHGKRVPNFRHLTWLTRCEILYWGDIDAQGFEILSTLRELFPQVVSLGMDGETVRRWSPELETTGTPSPWKRELTLTPEERQAYDWARDGWRRIEQERLPMGYISEILAKHPVRVD